MNRGRTILLLAVSVAAMMLLPMGASSDSMADGVHVLTAVSSHGTVLDASTGQPFSSGTVSGETVLAYVPNPGHEFVEWRVEGECLWGVDGPTIAVSALGGDVTATVVSRNYSTSQGLMTVVDSRGTPVPGDTLVNTWAFRSTELVQKGMVWEGTPSSPLVVGDAVYVRAGGTLYALDVHSGKVMESVPSVGPVGYYHSIGYGGGVIFDTVGHKAYDLDLNHLYDIPADLVYATFHDGRFYGFVETDAHGYFAVYETSADIDKDLFDGVKANLFGSDERYRVYNQWNQFTNAIFEGGFLFFVEADGKAGKTGWRAITAIDLETGVSTTVELEGFTGMHLDDGWLSYYDGHFYLTSYVVGLFGGIPAGLEGRHSSLMWVPFDFSAGVFGTPNYERIKTPDGKTFRGLASGLEIHNGRGYLNVVAFHDDGAPTSLIAHDIGSGGRPIPTEAVEGVRAHGGVVVNTAHGSEGKILVYVLPYAGDDQGIYVFTDEFGGGKWALTERARLDYDSSVEGYCSQAVRVGPSGQILFFGDHGHLQSFEAAGGLGMTVVSIDGNRATVQAPCGGSAAAALGSLYPGSTIDGGRITVGSKTYDVYGLNEIKGEYEALGNPYGDTYVGTVSSGITKAIYRQIAIVETGSEPRFSPSGEGGWYFLGDGGPERCDLRQRGSLMRAVGRPMVYSETVPDAEGFTIAPYETVARGSSIEIALPRGIETTFSVDDPEVIGVVLEGNALTVTGLKEDTATISLVAGWSEFTVVVDVLPKVTHINGDTVAESIKSRPLADGGREDSTVTTVTGDGGMSRDSTVRIYGPSGNLVEERASRMAKTREISQFMEGQLADTEEREEKVTGPSGDVVSHTWYRKESMSRGSHDSTLTTDVIEAERDVLTDTLTVSLTEEISNPAFNSTKTVVTVRKGDATLWETVEQTVESAGGNAVARMVEGVAVVTVSDGDPADVGGMVGVLHGSRGKPVRVDARGELSSGVLDAAADLGASLTMDAGSAKLFLGAGSLGCLRGKGDASFSVEEADVSKMTRVQRDAAGDAKVFSIVLSCGGSHQSGFGAFSIEMTCDLETRGEETPAVWRIDEYGKVADARDVSYADGKLNFGADHLSYYAVGYKPVSEGGCDAEGGGLPLIAIAAVAVAAAGAVAFLALRRK